MSFSHMPTERNIINTWTLDIEANIVRLACHRPPTHRKEGGQGEQQEVPCLNRHRSKVGLGKHHTNPGDTSDRCAQMPHVVRWHLVIHIHEHCFAPMS